MANIIVAVSGGVDSVVLLHMLKDGVEHTNEAAIGPQTKIIVTHFDHGIRDESSDDAKFVSLLAKSYGLEYESKREDLGPDASEELARNRRYTWLRHLAKKYSAPIYTAHHRDDMIGSIAINLSRGTGWRGLAVMDSPGITRPLLGMTKGQIYEYATKHRLEWVEDSTNQSMKYMRNRLRSGVMALAEETDRELEMLHVKQVQLKAEIDQELSKVVEHFGDNRHPYTMVQSAVATEILRWRYKLTRPTAERLLIGIKTARPNTKQDIGAGVQVHYDSKKFKIINS